MTYVYSLLFLPPDPSQLEVPKSAADTLFLPRVISHIMPCPAVADEADVIRSDLSS